MTRAPLRVVEEPYELVSPYSTCESDSSSVVQLILTVVAVAPVLVMFEMTGGVLSELSDQLVLFPLSTQAIAHVAMVALMLFESFTSSPRSVRLPCGLIFHWVLVRDDRSRSELPVDAVRVRRLLIVCVVPAAKVKVPVAVIAFVSL